MGERINRKTDQKIYQPRIHSERIRELHVVKEITKRPMTVLVDEALALYLSTFASTPEYKEHQARIETEWRLENEHDERFCERGTDDWEDMSNYYNL